MGIKTFLTLGNKCSSIITNRGVKCMYILVFAPVKVYGFNHD